jgi:3-hydroxyacyl-[acyl-carrier-protein] dehydratase
MSAFPAPTDLLPHRPPFLFVDEVTALGARASGHRAVAPHRRRVVLRRALPRPPHAAGRADVRGDRAVGAIAVLADERFAGKLPLFGGLDGARFRRQVAPATRSSSRRAGAHVGRAGKGTGRALLGGRSPASAS